MARRVDAAGVEACWRSRHIVRQSAQQRLRDLSHGRRGIVEHGRTPHWSMHVAVPGGAELPAAQPRDQLKHAQGMVLRLRHRGGRVAPQGKRRVALQTAGHVRERSSRVECPVARCGQCNARETVLRTSRRQLEPISRQQRRLEQVQEVGRHDESIRLVRNVAAVQDLADEVAEPEPIHRAVA